MRAVLAIFLIAAVATAATTSEQVSATIKNIEATKFGKTLLDTIQIQLQTNDPLDQLLQTLADLEDGLTADQKEDDANNSEFQASCDVDIHALDADLAQSEQKRVGLEAKLEGQLYPTQQLLSTLVNQKTRDVQVYTQDVNDVDNQRAEEKEEFDQKVNEHVEASEAIGEARRLFTDNLQSNGEAIFLQRGQINTKATITAQTASLIQKHFIVSAKHASKNIHRKAYAKIFKVLATISSKIHQVANQDSVSGLVTLIDQLLAKIQDSLDLERAAEDKRISAYNKSRRLLVVVLNIAQTSLANLSIDLASVEDQIVNAETSLENTEQRIANKSEERGDRNAQCEEAAQAYADARSVRDSDRSVVSDALGLINAQLRTLREQLALRQSAGDFD